VLVLMSIFFLFS